MITVLVIVITPIITSNNPAKLHNKNSFQKKECLSESFDIAVVISTLYVVVALVLFLLNLLFNVLLY